MKDQEVESKVYSFSTTSEKLQTALKELQDDKMLSASINKILKHHFKIFD